MDKGHTPGLMEDSPKELGREDKGMEASYFLTSMETKEKSSGIWGFKSTDEIVI
jgi:hypothetical protein